MKKTPGGFPYKTLPQGVCAIDGVNGETYALSQAQCDAFPAGRMLGQGSFASTYVHRDDPSKIVKFTADELDAKSAALLQGKKLKGATEVYDVALLKGHETSEGTPLHAIVAERVEPLHYATDRKVVSLLAEMNTPINNYAEGRGSFNKPPNLKSAKLGPKFKVPKKFRDIVERRCAFVSARDPDDIDCSKVPEIIGAMEDTAQKAGFFSGDLHEGNWGKRSDGSLVILDFGQSKQQKDEPIRELSGLRLTTLGVLGLAALAGGAIWFLRRRSAA